MFLQHFSILYSLIKLKQFCIIISISLVFITVPTTCTGTEIWQQVYGGDIYQTGKDVIEASDGGYIAVGGQMSGNGNKAHGQMYIIKTDSNGNLLWEKLYGDKYSDACSSIDYAHDSGYIITGCWGLPGWDYSLCIMKLNTAGDMEWKKLYGGDVAIGRCIKRTNDGGYIAAGNSSFDSILHAYLIKTDNTGNMEWERSFSKDTYNDFQSICLTRDDGYVIVGQTYNNQGHIYLIKTDSHGEIKWEKVIGGERIENGFDVQQTKDDGYIITGISYTDGKTPDQEVYLVKTNSNGEVIWEKRYEGGGFGIGHSVIPLSDGGYLVGGGRKSYISAYSDIYIIRTDSQGNIIWDETYGGVKNDFLASMKQTNDGHFIVTGWTFNYGDITDPDLLLLKLDLNIPTSINPTANTKGANDITEHTAVLRGEIVNDGDEICQYRFRYKEESGEYIYTSWTGSVSTGQVFNEMVSDLESETQYIFSAQARNSAGQGEWGEDIYFVTDSPCSEDSYRAWGYIKDSEGIGVNGATVKLLKWNGEYFASYEDCLPSEGDGTGFYKTSCVNIDGSFLAGLDKIEAQLDNDILRVSDLSFTDWTSIISEIDLSPIISKSEFIPNSESPIRVDITFGTGERAINESNALRVFRETHKAYQYINNNYDFTPDKVYVWINYPMSIPADYNSLFNVIRFSSDFDNYQIWHEYAHAIHHQNCNYIVLPSKWEWLSEGWAIHFHRNIFMSPGYDPYDDNITKRSIIADTEAHEWGMVYASIFHDIMDGQGEDGKDPLDGSVLYDDIVEEDQVNGEQMIWRILMNDQALDMRDFYNKFSQRYPNLQNDIDEILQSHELTPDDL
jgi:hypothetical protein